MDNLKTSPCRGCGKPILWGMTADGKKIPLDPRAPVYIVLEWKNTEHGQEVQTCQRLDKTFVSHWATCPEAYKPKGNRAWENHRDA